MSVARAVAAAIAADIFLACLDHFLCPALTPGDGVVMDNLSSHKVDGVRQRIEAAGADLLYLPPYSPDLNPIEKAWSKFQQLLRSANARMEQALDQPSQKPSRKYPQTMHGAGSPLTGTARMKLL